VSRRARVVSVGTGCSCGSVFSTRRTRLAQVAFIDSFRTFAAQIVETLVDRDFVDPVISELRKSNS